MGTVASDKNVINKEKQKKHNPKKQTNKKITNVEEEVEKLEPCALLAGIYNSTAIVENSMAVPQKIKHRITI